jgi:diguanylate cyclase (GGDEF)-like protein
LVASQTRDLTEANRRLAELASRDPLTNIFNRRSFYDLAEREVERARRTQRPISLLMIDVDHFKRVNDRFGHSAGDAVLRGLVAMIQPLLRDVDIFARIGGEELVVMMPETAAAAARLVAERLRQAVAASQLLADNDQLRVTISVGLATACGDETLASLIERADQALYIAKAGGRDRVIDAAPVDVA